MNKTTLSVLTVCLIVIIAGVAIYVYVSKAKSKADSNKTFNLNASVLTFSPKVSTQNWKQALNDEYSISFSYPSSYHLVGPKTESLADFTSYVLIGANPPFGRVGDPEPIRTSDSNPLFQVRIYNEPYARFLESTVNDYGSSARSTGQRVTIGGVTGAVIETAVDEVYAIDRGNKTFVFKQGDTLTDEEQAVFTTILSSIVFLSQ